MLSGVVMVISSFIVEVEAWCELMGAVMGSVQGGIDTGISKMNGGMVVVATKEGMIGVNSEVDGGGSGSETGIGDEMGGRDVAVRGGDDECGGDVGAVCGGSDV